MIKVCKIFDEANKEKVTNDVLRNLPEWFSPEESIIEYSEGARKTDFYIAYDLDKPVGLISIKFNNEHTAEIYVIGVLRDYHNKKIGTMLIDKVKYDLLNNNYKFLMVKTLGDSHPDENYKKTRSFYKSNGFYPLEEIKEIWSESVPCLIMIQKL